MNPRVVLIVVITVSNGPLFADDKGKSAIEAGQAAKLAPPVRYDLYGDPLPAGAISRLGTTRFRYGDRIDGLAVSPDGKTIATAGRNVWSIVTLWDASTGRERFRLGRIGTGLATALTVAFSPDGRIVAAAGLLTQGALPNLRGMWTIWLWDAETGKELGILQDPRAPIEHVMVYEPGMHISFSSDGRMVGLCTKSLTLWDVATRQTVCSTDTGFQGIHGPVFFSPTSPLVARLAYKGQGGPDTEIRFHDAKTLKEVRAFRDPELREWTSFSPDGRLIACSTKNSVALIEVETGHVVRQFEPKASPISVTFSPNGQRLAAASDAGMENYHIQVWDVHDGHEVCWMKPNNGHEYRVYSIAFVNDRQLISAGQDGMVHFWDATSGASIDETQGQCGHRGGANGVAYPDKGQIVSAGGDGQVLWWDAPSGSVLRRRMMSGRPVPTGSKGTVNNCGLHSLTLSTDHRALAVGGYDGRIRMLDAASGNETGLIDVLPSGVMGLAFGPGKELASAGSQGPLTLWDTASGQALQSFPGTAKHFLAGPCFSPDGSWLAVAARPMIRPRGFPPPALPGSHTVTWSAQTGQEIRRFSVPERPAMNIALSPDGRKLAVSYMSGVIVLWNPDNGRVRRELKENRPSRGIAFSPDGQLLCVGDAQGRVSIWDLLTAKETVCDPGDGAEITCASFAPDGANFATAGHDTTIMVWDATGRLGNTPSELSPGNTDRLWADLGSGDLMTWRRAYFTLAAEPAAALQACRQRMRAAGEPDCSKLPDLLAGLDSNAFIERSRATGGLKKMLADAEKSFVVEQAIRQFVSASPSLEARTRADQLLTDFREPIPNTDMRRELRAVSLLAKIATPESQQLLQTLAGGSENARLTQEAKVSLERLARH